MESISAEQVEKFETWFLALKLKKVIFDKNGSHDPRSFCTKDFSTDFSSPDMAKSVYKKSGPVM